MQCESAADKVHYLQAVAVAQLGGGPGIAAHNDVVQFDGHAVGLDAQLFDQRSQRQAVAEAAFFAIDHEFHEKYCRSSRITKIGKTLWTQESDSPLNHPNSIVCS